MTFTFDKDLIEVGERIREKRKAQGLSQEQLSEKIGLIGNTISRIENAETSIRLDKLFKICEVLKAAPEELLPKRFHKESLRHESNVLAELFRRLEERDQALIYNTMLSLTQRLIEDQERR